MKTTYLYQLIGLGFILALITSCTKMNDFHDVYLKRGETVYVGRVDSAEVFAGNGRVLLRFWSSDPKAKKLMLYWNSKTDSMLLDIPEKSGKDPVEVIINDLEETNYFFEMVTMNQELKNRSIVFQKGGSVYGAKFQASILTRQIRTAVFMPTGETEIRWLGAVEKALGTDLEYTSKLGKKVKKFVPIAEEITTISDLASDLKYRTLFLPEPKAIDTFYTEYQSVNPGLLTELAQSKYVKWNPVGIPYNEHSAPYPITKLWDKNLDSWYIQRLPARLAPANPHNFTFDLGQTVKLNRFKQWQRLTNGVVYQIQNVRKFEVWGSNTPNVTADFSGWVKLGDFESIKPSGRPWSSTAGGNVTDDDRAYAAKGEVFIVSTVAPPVRYIRYVVKATWSTGETSTDTDLAIGEVSFFEVK